MPPKTVWIHGQTFTLESMDLHSESQIEELIQQRLVCGWNYLRQNIIEWRDLVDAGQKHMWWIVRLQPPSARATATNGTTPELEAPQTARRIGHISLASVAYPPDLSLANPDGSTLTLSAFFIQPEFQGGGLGRACVAEVERRAAELPTCKEIALDTLSRRYWEEEGPKWAGRPSLANRQPPLQPGASNEDWYARMGYVKYKEEPRYQETPGGDEYLLAVFMRKKLK